MSRSNFLTPLGRLSRLPLPLRLLAWYGFVCGLLYSVQSDLLYHPTRVAPQQLASILEALSAQQRTAGLVHQGLGLKLSIPATSAPSRATALLFHGNGGSALDRVALQDHFSARGYELILAEYAGYGWQMSARAGDDDGSRASSGRSQHMAVLHERSGLGRVAENLDLLH